MENCACSKSYQNSEDINCFLSIRENCPVLRDIIIPSEIFEDYKNAISKPRGSILKTPIFYSLFEHQILFHFTNPIHKYIIERIEQVNKSYKKSLQEKWFIEATDEKRNECYRKYMGRISEILLINYLADKGYNIESYEAIGAKHDILYRINNVQFCSEIKYLGIEDKDFLSLVEYEKRGGSALNSSPYPPYNYLIFRIFEAAKQLSISNEKKSVFIIFCNFTWSRHYHFIIKNNFIDWDRNRPEFLNPDEPVWSEFINKKKQKMKFAEIEDELHPFIESLDQITLMYMSNSYELNEAFSINMKEHY